MLYGFFPVSNSNQTQITRFKAIPTTKTFEMFLASNQIDMQPSTGGYDARIGAGFRMISNGSYIYADGTIYDMADSTFKKFNVCIDATTLTLDTSEVADCTTLANSFTLDNTSASLTFATVTGYSNLAIPPGLSSCAGVTSAADGSTLSAATCIPSPSSNATQVTPNSTVQNIFQTYFDIRTPGVTAFK